MKSFHPHREFPEDCLPLEAAIWWRDNANLFLRCLTQPKYRRFYADSRLSGNLIIYPPKCYMNGENMNGRKPKRNGTGNSVGINKPSTFQWINVTLTDQDLDILEREKADLEQLALAFISLGVQQLGLSVKYDRVGESYSVSIYGSDMANDGKPCGISGASSELRDALLVALYRFNNCLQGSFDGRTNSNPTIQSRRFR